MGRLRTARPQPALIVAVLALVAALAGTAVAEEATTSVSKKATKKIAKQQAKKQINKLAPGLSVASADTADSANTLTNVTVQRTDFQVADNSANGALVSCPAGQQALSGGVITGANDSYITNSVPANALIGDLNDGQTFSGWRGFVVNQLGQSGTITSTVYVVCAGG